MKLFIYPPTSIDTSGLATEAKQDAQIAELQNIVTEINNLEIDVESININVDGVETLLTTANSTLTSLETILNTHSTKLDGIDTSVDDVTAMLLGIDTNIANIDTTSTNSNTLLTNIDSTLSTVSTNVADIENLITTLNTYVDNVESLLTSINNNVGYLSPKLDTISKKTILDTRAISGLIDASATNIPTTGGLEVFASAIDDFYRFQTIDDIGEYMVLCVGAVGSEAPVAALPLGGGEVTVRVAQGTRISLRSISGAAITSGKIIINALGLGQP